MRTRPRTMLLLVAAVLIAAVVAGRRAAAEEPWAFAVMCDGRPGKYTDEKGVPGFKKDLTALKRLYFDGATKDKPAPEFLLMPGDIDPPMLTDRLVGEVLGEDFPWVPVLGNHDTSLTCRRQLRRIFDKYRARLGFKEGPTGTPKLQYSMAYKNLFLVVINTYWDGTDGFYAEVGTVREKKSRDRIVYVLDSNIVPANLEWIRKTLAASDAPYKIVAGHEPAWPHYRYVSSALSDHPKERDLFWKALGEANVHIFFHGHTHYYAAYQWLGNKDPRRWQGYTSRVIPDPIGTWQIDAGATRGTVNRPKVKNLYHRVVVYCKVADEAIEVEVAVSLRNKEGDEWGPWHVPKNGAEILPHMPRKLYSWKIYPDIRKNLPQR